MKTTAEFRLTEVLSGDALDDTVAVPRWAQFVDAAADGRDLVLYAIVSDSESFIESTNRRVILRPTGEEIPVGGISYLKTIPTDCGPMFVFLENPVVHSYELHSYEQHV